MRAPRLPAIILGFRARVLAYAAAGVSLVFGMPRQHGGFVDFLLTPPGLAVGAAALVALGSSVEETGTLARIRAGIGVRLAAPAVLAAGAAWAAAIDATSAGGWTAFALFCILIALVTAHDASLLGDLRRGETTRLETIGADGLKISVDGAPILVPLDAVAGASVGKSLAGHAALVHVARRDRIHGDASRLPWIVSTVATDVFALSEHQCNRDARTVVGEIAACAARDDSYRGPPRANAPEGGKGEA